MSYKELKEEFDKKVELLRKNCKHENLSDWTDYMWAPAHVLGKCKFCLYCEEIIENTWENERNYKIKATIKK